MREVVQESKFKYIETKGGDEVLLLLHGLFGAMSNFASILDTFGKKMNVVVPLLPIMELPVRELDLSGLVEYVKEFIDLKGYNKINLLGNSLGGHLAQLYTLDYPDKISSIVLTGSSGLFEKGLGNSFLKRGDKNYIKKKAQETFYDPDLATDDLVDEIYGLINNRHSAIRLIATAKSAIRHNLSDKLHNIKKPTLLVWGKDDSITPPFVGERFHKLLKNSRLLFLEKCGHAPMMERPKEFNRALLSFLEEVKSGAK